MNTKTCPFLGMKDDPSTALDFPSPGNFCHHARPVRPVKSAYQELVCLTGDHISCPLYRAANPQPMPAHIAGEHASRIGGKRAIAILAIPALIAGVAALSMAWSTFGKQLSPQTRVVPGTGGEQQSPAVSSLIAETPVVPPSPTKNSSESDLPLNCPVPNGWVPYTVSPTDSLYRLSVVYGASIDDLQKVNCMGDKTVILPGQIIYVPFLPTRTPSSTPTRIPFVPTSTRAAQEDEPVLQPSSTPGPDEGEQDPPTSTPVPPTAAPPPTQEPTAQRTDPPAQPTDPPAQPTDPPAQPTDPPAQPTDSPKPPPRDHPTKEPKPTKPPKDETQNPGNGSNETISIIEDFQDLINRLYPEGLP